jgi:long-subunit acyl-CoA synthetase (AMP-forming)
VPFHSGKSTYIALRVKQGRTVLQRGGAFSWNELLLSPPLLTAPSVEHDAISTIGYTSGTTGRAKGAVLTYRCVILNTALNEARFRRDHSC